MSELYLYDFGIFVDLQPDEEQKAVLENNIQTALQAGLIDLTDAIDIREIQNIKLANQLLKIKRVEKQEREQQLQQQNIQAQSQANAQATQVAAQAEVQKQQALMQQKMELEQMKAKIDLDKMQAEINAKKELMNLEFQMNMQLKGLETQGKKSEAADREDRKDERTKIQATQQSELINQRQNDTMPKNFESAGNDVLNGSFNLGSGDPR